MPSTSSHAADRRARIERLERLAHHLDSRFRIPGLGIPVGWDSILGLIPGLGDAATAVPGAVMLYEASRMGARKRAMARIAANTGIDLVLGAVPLIGDAFDLFFKSHRRNIRILRQELERIETKEGKEETWQTARDRTTEAATPRKSSGPGATSRNPAAPEDRFSATSRPKTS